MSVETYSYTIDEIFADEAPVPQTASVTVLSGQNLAVLTIVESDANGKIKAHAGFTSTQFVTASGTPDTKVAVDTTRPVAGVMIAAVDASLADKAGNIWTDGCFMADKLVWPASADTNAKKLKLLEGSGIRVKFYGTGELAPSL